MSGPEVPRAFWSVRLEVKHAGAVTFQYDSVVYGGGGEELSFWGLFVFLWLLFSSVRLFVCRWCRWGECIGDDGLNCGDDIGDDVRKCRLAIESRIIVSVWSNWGLSAGVKPASLTSLYFKVSMSCWVVRATFHNGNRREIWKLLFDSNVLRFETS